MTGTHPPPAASGPLAVAAAGTPPQAPLSCKPLPRLLGPVSPGRGGTTRFPHAFLGICAHLGPHTHLGPCTHLGACAHLRPRTHLGAEPPQPPACLTHVATDPAIFPQTFRGPSSRAEPRAPLNGHSALSREVSEPPGAWGHPAAFRSFGAPLDPGGCEVPPGSCP
ncbi:hypothetical protein VULLAG_LOCUS10216 [Vulpes lagopus]